MGPSQAFAVCPAGQHPRGEVMLAWTEDVSSCSKSWSSLALKIKYLLQGFKLLDLGCCTERTVPALPL